MPYSHFELATWSLPSTVTHHIYQKPKPTAHPGAIFHVWQSRKSGHQWGCPHDRTDYQNLHVLSIRSIVGSSLHQFPRGRNSPTQNLRNGTQKTTNPVETDNTTTLGVVKNNVMKNSNRWTWSFIGYVSGRAKANSDITGRQGKKTEPTMSQKTMQPSITEQSDRKFWHQNVNWTS